MPTISQSAPTPPANGWVLYDGDCGMCLSLVNRYQALLRRYGFETTPLQTGWVRETLGLADEHHTSELLKEMRVLTPSGQVYGGADSILHILKAMRWLYPLYLLSFVPGVKPLLRKTYREIAKRRHCTAGACKRPEP